MTYAKVLSLLILLVAGMASAEEPIPPVVERITFPAAGEDAPMLEGELWVPLRATAATRVPGVVLCHPHPLYGGNMDNTVVMDLRDQLLEMGIATLRFNFRSVGASEGEFGDGVAEVNDVLGAMAALRARPEVQADRCGLTGYSFGAAMTLKAAAALGDVTACGLVGFPTEVEGEAQEEFAHLSQVKAPLVFVTGSEDIYSSAQALAQLVADHRLTADVVPLEGADHFFTEARGRRIMAQAIADFLSRHLLAEQ